MNRDFGLFVNGFFICASSQRVDMTSENISEQVLYQSNDALGMPTNYRRDRAELLPYENYTFYSINLEKRIIIDELKFKVDRTILIFIFIVSSKN